MYRLIVLLFLAQVPRCLMPALRLLQIRRVAAILFGVLKGSVTCARVLRRKSHEGNHHTWFVTSPITPLNCLSLAATHGNISMLEEKSIKDGTPTLRSELIVLPYNRSTFTILTVSEGRGARPGHHRGSAMK